MKIRLGYACISKTLDYITTSSSYTYTHFQQEKDYDKLKRIIRSNLEDLEKIIDYNIANNIHFFRLSSKLIPLATHDEVELDYITPYQEEYKRVGEKIRESHMRVDFHPDQFCILNSVKEGVIRNSKKILKYHYQLLEAFQIEPKRMVLHVGGNTFGKEKSLTRFVHQFKTLPKEIQESIVIENDDKVFNIMDCLTLSKRVGVPVVLDYHHYCCNPGGVDLSDYLKDIFETWKGETPKMHFSSPKNHSKKDFRSHHDYIDAEEFIKFIELLKKENRDVDIMLEAKAKDEALFRLIRELRYKTNYRFLDETTIVI